MSLVTNVIIDLGLWGTDEELETGRLAKVNEFFDDGFGFIGVKDEKLPRHWYGGTKALECNLAIGAFNYLNLEGLIKHIKACGIIEKGEVIQLIVKEQEEERFRIIDIE